MDLKRVGFPYYLPKTKLVQLLSERYPNYKWEKVYLLRGRYAQQKRLERAVAVLCPVRVLIACSIDNHFHIQRAMT